MTAARRPHLHRSLADSMPVPTARLRRPLHATKVCRAAQKRSRSLRMLDGLLRVLGPKTAKEWCLPKPALLPIPSPRLPMRLPCPPIAASARRSPCAVLPSKRLSSLPCISLASIPSTTRPSRSTCSAGSHLCILFTLDQSTPQSPISSTSSRQCVSDLCSPSAGHLGIAFAVDSQKGWHQKADAPVRPVLSLPPSTSALPSIIISISPRSSLCLLIYSSIAPRSNRPSCHGHRRRSSSSPKAACGQWHFCAPKQNVWRRGIVNTAANVIVNGKFDTVEREKVGGPRLVVGRATRSTNRCQNSRIKTCAASWPTGSADILSYRRRIPHRSAQLHSQDCRGGLKVRHCQDRATRGMEPAICD
jgi:hypothetical protein